MTIINFRVLDLLEVDIFGILSKQKVDETATGRSGTMVHLILFLSIKYNFISRSWEIFFEVFKYLSWRSRGI